MKSRMLLSVVALAGLANLLAACGAATPAAPQSPQESLYVYPPEATEAATEAAYPEFEAAPDGQAAATEEAAESGQPQDMFFQDYGTNPFVDVTKDGLSTFAVDIDTGSYTLSRSYLRDGNLPPPEAVRLEEFVNYFQQDYPLPQGKGFSISMDAAHTPFNAADSYVMRVGIQGYEVAEEQRPDANLTFVVDISGSMDEDNRLGAVKNALTSLVDNLRPTDTIGIVVYGSNGRILLEPTPVSDRQRIIDAIWWLQPDGSTNAEEGLRLGYEVATGNFDKDKINRIILCSDGVANVGATGPDQILQIVRRQAADGISLTTVGFGMGNYNDVLMEQLANDGDGAYHYVDTQDEARKLFDTGLTGTLLTIGKNAKIQVEFNPDAVKAYRLMGYENRAVADQDFRNDQVDAGEIGAGHTVTALYEVIPSGQAQPDAIIATVRMRWEDPDTGEVTEIEQAMRVADVLADFAQSSPRFRLDIAAAAFADLLGDGGWAQNASYGDVLAVAQQAAHDLPQDEDVQEFVQIVETAAQLNQ
jgi:Ca-activated chloride channel family protein